MTKKEYFEKFESIYTPNQLMKLKIAYILAKDAHRGTTRKTGSRYFEHPRRVSCRLFSLGLTDLVYHLTALCHDLVEDTEITAEMLEFLFGEEVARNVVLLTKKQDETKKDYFLRINLSKVAVAVKMADKLDNILDVNSETPLEKISEWKEEGKQLLKFINTENEKISLELNRVCM